MRLVHGEKTGKRIKCDTCGLMGWEWASTNGDHVAKVCYDCAYRVAYASYRRMQSHPLTQMLGKYL
jgi:hypothetical protein